MNLRISPFVQTVNEHMHAGPVWPTPRHRSYCRTELKITTIAQRLHKLVDAMRGMANRKKRDGQRFSPRPTHYGECGLVDR